MSTPPIGVVLAAGKGTRMRSKRPKVLHEAGGRPLLAWVLDAAREAGCSRICVVVGHGAREIRERFAGAENLVWVHQERQLGTGHALLQVRSVVDEACRLVVLSGDVPRVRAETIRDLVRASEGRDGALAVAEMEEPGGLGRVVSDGHRLERIVEASDATEEELAISRINAGLYALRAPEIFGYLEGLDPDNAQGELYLTDAVTRWAGEGEIVLYELGDPTEAIGVNDRSQLAAAHRAILGERRRRWMEAGVTLIAPSRVEIGPEVELSRDVELHPDVSLGGRTRIGRGAVIHQGSWIRDTRVGAGVEILPYSVLDGAEVGAEARVGPFARLRPGAEIGPEAKIGNFVEIKESRLAEGVKASHLAYLGDADVGAGVNIGAGVVTCNYDGERKHRTEIGPGAFVGSDTMLVAPVRVGRDAATGAGSVISRDVPDGALGITRSRQRTVPDWTRRRRIADGDGETEG